MKITALYHHRTQATDAQGIHINEMVQAFQRQGVDIKMVALVKDEAIGRASREGRLGRIARWMPALLYEFMEIGFNLPGIVRLFRAAVQETPAFIYERYSIYNIAGLAVSKLTGIPLIVEVNAPLAHEKKAYGRLYFPKLAQAIETFIINHSYKTIAVTHVLKKILVSKQADPGKIVVMANGINLEEYPPISLDYRKEDIVLGFIGWFRKWHGLEELVDIFAQQEWMKKGRRLLLVGDGPLRVKLERKIAQYGLEKPVTVTGAVPRDDLANYLAQIDIALQPAATPYASPMKLIEYMASGKAIVAPDQPNINELLIHGENAILFKPNDFADMAEKIEILAMDRVLAETLGKGARATVASRPLTWDHNARQVIGMMSEMRPPHGWHQRDRN